MIRKIWTGFVSVTLMIVLFAALIGAFVLKESFGPVRIAAATLLLAGLMLVQFS